MPHILVIGGRDFTMRCYPALKLKFTLIQRQDHATDYQREISHKCVEFDYHKSSSLELAKQLHKEDPFTHIVSVTEFGLQPAADISEALNLPTNCEPRAIRITRDKVLMREALEEAGLNTVPFKRIHTLEDLESFLELHGKAIVKPASGAGSFGVQLIEDKAQAKKAMEHAAAVNMGDTFAEGFIGGTEYSIESMSKNGHHEIITITEKLTTGAPHFVESGHTQPARLPADIR